MLRVDPADGCRKMSTYSNQDFERIAETIAKSPAHVITYANRFEAAAAWYRLYCRAPKGILLADTKTDRVLGIAEAQISSLGAHKVRLLQRQLHEVRRQSVCLCRSA
jgi:hypothetical protein